jgi:single-stranded DNA-binding protein
MIECAFAGRLGRDAELKHVKNRALPMLAFSAAVEGRHIGDEPPAARGATRAGKEPSYERL